MNLKEEKHNFMNQIYSGTVISQKNAKTASVEIISHYRHPKYKKVIRHKKKVQAHNENLLLQIGDKVTIKSSRPYSKTKRFLVIKKEESKK